MSKKKHQLGHGRHLGPRLPKKDIPAEEKKEITTLAITTGDLCSLCKKLLKRTKWNTKGNILYCPNSECRRYHEPQRWVPVEDQSMSEVNST